MKDWLTEQRLPANQNIELVIETEVLDDSNGKGYRSALSAIFNDAPRGRTTTREPIHIDRRRTDQ